MKLGWQRMVRAVALAIGLLAVPGLAAADTDPQQWIDFVANMGQGGAPQTYVKPVTLAPVYVPPPIKKPVKTVKKITGCEEGFKLVSGKCKKIAAYAKPQGCPAGTVPVPETDNCVKPASKTVNKNVDNGFEKAPWKKPGCNIWKVACSLGDANSCASYESTCQVN